ncbi:MAG: hypothetical protein ACFFD4_28805 [Candidatus Odinarchaeota archaeon]
MAADKPKFTAVLEWNEGERDFFQVKNPNDEIIYAIIDEEQEKVFLHFPVKTKLVTRRTVERRVKSIAKSGFELPNQNLRIGMGFEIVETGSDTVIPDILLQVGHGYVGFDEKVESTESKRKILAKATLSTPIAEQLQAVEEEEEKPLPPPKAPGKRRKKHLTKPTLSGSPIRTKDMERETEVSRKPAVHEEEIQKDKPKIAFRDAISAEGIDPETLGLGAVLRTFIEDSENLYISKREDNRFVVESGSSLVEFRLSSGKLELLRSMKSTKTSFNIKDFEKRLNQFL